LVVSHTSFVILKSVFFQE